MKLFRKLTIFCLSVLTCCSVAFAVACGGDPGNTSNDVNSSESSSSSEESSSSEDESSYVYRISVQNPTGFGLRKVTVKLMDGEREIASETTNNDGYAYFRNDENAIPVGKYTVVIDELPAGYTYLNADETYQTLEGMGTEVVIPLTPTGVLDGELPDGQIYRLGDVIHDFTTITAENETFTLSDVLQERQLVVINFWALRCGPCKQEFPIMNQALLMYKDTVDCIAFNQEDTKDQILSYKFSSEFSFKMTNVYASNMVSKFGVSAIPQTVMIDRYGVVVFNEVGSMLNLTEWTNVFDTFLGDDYVPTVWGTNNNNGSIGVPEGQDRIEPLVPAPSFDEVKQALGTEDNFSYRWQAEGVLSEDDSAYDKYSWPWVVKKDTDGTSYLRAGNTVVPTGDDDEVPVDYSYATLYADFEANGGDVLVFDYMVGSEKNCDILYILVDGVIVQQLSGYQTERWNTCYAYVFKDEEAGNHEIAFLYNKDYDKSAYGDVVNVRNLRLETLSGGISDSKDALVFRYAATVPNTEEGATTQFKNYVDVVLNEEDGYLHVGKADGPILFADLWFSTQWNYMSVWQLAFNDYCVAEGFNYHASFEPYAWAANNNIISEMYLYGLVPVTEELRDLLKILTEYVPYNEEWDGFDGPYHENEWLEICCYYEPYGDTPQLEDPLKTITFDAAEEIFVGNNQVNVPFAINPRGFKYKFIPETSGAYKVYSTGDTDTFAFLVAGDRTTSLGAWDDKVSAEMVKDENGVNVTDGNFEFYWYFEAGETYYMLFTTYLDQVATYNVTIEYLGESYTYMENAATALYSANLVTGALFLPDAVDYAYDATYIYDERAHAKDPTKGIGCYRYVDKNGDMGSPIYLDIWRPTSFLPDTSLYKLAKAYKDKNVPVEKRELYIRGVDYTDMVLKYGLDASMVPGMLYGYVVVTQEIYEFLYALTVYTVHEGISDTWLTLCYYTKTIGKQK